MICIANAAKVHVQKLQLIQINCTGFLPLKDHVVSFANNRLDLIQKNSPLEAKPINPYSLVRHMNTNQLPLDVIYNNM